MKKTLLQKYFTDQMKAKKEVEFNRLVQGSLFVVDYEVKFTSLTKFTDPFVHDEGRKARKFVKGLNGYIRTHMCLKRYEDYSKAVKNALNVEVNEVKRPQEPNQNFKRTQPYQGGSSEDNRKGSFDAQKRQR